MNRRIKNINKVIDFSTGIRYYFQFMFDKKLIYFLKIKFLEKKNPIVEFKQKPSDILLKLLENAVICHNLKGKL